MSEEKESKTAKPVKPPESPVNPTFKKLYDALCVREIVLKFAAKDSEPFTTRKATEEGCINRLLLAASSATGGV